MKFTIIPLLCLSIFCSLQGICQVTTPIGLKIDQGQKVVFGDDEPAEDNSNGTGEIKGNVLKRGESHTYFTYDPVKAYLLVGSVNSQNYTAANYGFGSTTLGTENHGFGPNSFAGGYQSLAQGDASIAFGTTTFTSGVASQCFGTYTSNVTPNSMVIGQFNNPIYTEIRTEPLDSTSALLLVGNGASQFERSNAMEVYFDGTLNLSKQKNLGSNIRGLTLQADDIYMDAAGPQKFGDDLSGNDGGKGDPFLLSTGEGSNESAGIYGDGDALVLFSEGESPGSSGLNGYVFILDASNFLGNDNDPYNSGALKAYIDGSGIWQTSDKRKKENIKRIETATDKINKLHGYTYSFKELSNDKIQSQPSVGFMAQELQKVIPEAVQQSAHGDYFVNYTMVVPVLTEALKEQNDKIEMLLKENKKMALQIKELNAFQKQQLEKE